MLGQVLPTYLLTDLVCPLTLGIVANRLLQHVCGAFSIIVVVVFVAVVGIVRDQGILEYQSREVDLLEETVVVSGHPYSFGD
jgi:type IV secretory pathway VirB2 component (pilin)